MILESLRAFIYAYGQYSPDHNHQNEPQQRKNQERQGLYDPEVKQNGGSNREHIDKDQQDLYFRPGKKMIS
jgi:hypothetical protein